MDHAEQHRAHFLMMTHEHGQKRGPLTPSHCCAPIQEGSTFIFPIVRDQAYWMKINHNLKFSFISHNWSWTSNWVLTRFSNQVHLSVNPLHSDPEAKRLQGNVWGFLKFTEIITRRLIRSPISWSKLLKISTKTAQQVPWLHLHFIWILAWCSSYNILGIWIFERSPKSEDLCWKGLYIT